MVNSKNIPCLSSFLIDLFVWVFNILFLLFEVSNCIKINNLNKPAMVAEWLKSFFLEPTSDLGLSFFLSELYGDSLKQNILNQMSNFDVANWRTKK